MDSAKVLPKLAWSINEAAKATSTSPSFIRNAIQGKVAGKSKLPIVRVGRRVLILDRDLRQWLEGLSWE